MKTNDLKKGALVILRNGWEAEIADNKKGTIRLAKVFGNYTELGSVYAYDIMQAIVDGKRVDIEHTKEQLKHRDIVSNLKF